VGSDDEHGLGPEVFELEERRRHRRGSFADRDHMIRPARHDVFEIGRLECVGDHTASADRVDAGADDFQKVLPER